MPEERRRRLLEEDRVGTQADRGPGSAWAMFDEDVASRSLGIELLEAGHGRAVARMRVTDRMVNGHAIAHGGYLFLLADTAFACACNSHGPVTVAAGAEISFVASARLGDLLVATAQERTRYGRNGIYDVTVHREREAGAEPGNGLDVREIPEVPAVREVIAEFRGRSRVIAKQEVRR